MAGFQKLPLEIRQEVWRLALLPEPAVYGYNARDLWRGWQVPKDRHPAAARVNRESRAVALALRQSERRRVAVGLPSEYWFGLRRRPFVGEMDAFWIDDPTTLCDFAGAVERGRGSGRRWGISHLALSARCFEEVFQGMQYLDEYNGYDYDYGYHEEDGSQPIRSGWDAIKPCLGDLEGLERISVVFGPIFYWSGRPMTRYDEGTESYSHVTVYDIPDVRLEDWTTGSSEQTQAQVDGLLAKARADIAWDIEAYNQEREAWERFNGYGWAVPMRYNASSSPVPCRDVTVQAVRMVKVGEFRG